MHNSKIKVVISGALGKMGTAAIDTFLQSPDKYELIAATVRDLNSISDKVKKHFKELNINLIDNLEDYLHNNQVDVLVELTTPDSVFRNAKLALNNGVRPVIGATGLNEEDIQALAKLSKIYGLGTIVAPNFALGALLMMRFAKEASKFYDKAEIVELHHDKKVDKPSGTAIKTAKLIEENIKNDTEIHSVRLPGFVAKQQVIFGATGETLTIEHNSIDRSCFMPGIKLAVNKVVTLDYLVYGLENIIE